MREHLSSKRGNAQQFGSRRIASTVLCASLMAGIAWVEPTAAIGQAISSDMQPPAGMRTTSQPATRPEGIPLGSTEIATPASVRPYLRKERSRRAVPALTVPDRPTLRSTGVEFREPRRSPAPIAAIFRLPFLYPRRSGESEFPWAQPKSVVPASAQLRLWPTQVCLAAPVRPTACQRSPPPAIPEIKLHKGTRS